MFQIIDAQEHAHNLVWMMILEDTNNSECSGKRLLVVDDDIELCDLLIRYLSDFGFVVDSVGNGSEMDNYLNKTRPNLIILDLMLPGEDGLSLAKRLRSRQNLPIIMLSARGDDVDRIIGLEMGADDYIAKPFNPRELLARIKALLRRTSNDDVKEVKQPHTYSFDKFILDIEKQELLSNDEVIPITTGEFLLLRVLVENPNQELNRDALIHKLKGYERLPYDRSIDVCISRLRKKIEPDIANPRFIRTVWGRGYIFTPTGNHREHH